MMAADDQDPKPPKPPTDESKGNEPKEGTGTERETKAKSDPVDSNSPNAGARSQSSSAPAGGGPGGSLEDLVQPQSEQVQVPAPWTERALAAIEPGFVLVLAAIVFVAFVRYALANGCSLDGLLTLLDQKWKGTLLLGALLFYRTLRLLLERIEGVSPITMKKPRSGEVVKITPGES